MDRLTGVGTIAVVVPWLAHRCWYRYRASVTRVGVDLDVPPVSIPNNYLDDVSNDPINAMLIRPVVVRPVVAVTATVGATKALSSSSSSPDLIGIGSQFDKA